MHDPGDPGRGLSPDECPGQTDETDYKRQRPAGQTTRIAHFAFPLASSFCPPK